MIANFKKHNGKVKYNMESFSTQIKKSINGDEYYSTPPVVQMIIPILHRNNMHNIWCPFDTAESNFVKILKEEGFNVIHGHISTGEDFFEYKNPPDNIDCIVSNPPFSKRDAIFERLYEFDIPFAMVMNFNGLFDSKKRYDIFKRNDIQMFVPQGRMKFIAKDKGQLNSPNFQSIYVCHKLLCKQIEFADIKF